MGILSYVSRDKCFFYKFLLNIRISTKSLLGVKIFLESSKNSCDIM